MQLRAGYVATPQTKQDRSKFRRFMHLSTQRMCLQVGVLYLDRGMTLGRYQCSAQADVQRQFVLSARRRVREVLEQFDSSVEMPCGFHKGRTVAGVLSCQLPVEHASLAEACCG